jgi:hypothetical protein
VEGVGQEALQGRSVHMHLQGSLSKGSAHHSTCHTQLQPNIHVPLSATLR